MKRILFALLLGLCATAAFAQPAPVSGQNVNSLSDSTCSNGAFTACVLDAFPMNTQVGDAIILMGFFCTENSCSTPSANDVTIQTAQGDAFTKCFEAFPGSASLRYAIWSANVTMAGSAVITASQTSGNLHFGVFQATAFTGVKTSSPCDSAVGVTASGTGTSLSATGAGATAECNELVYSSPNYGTGTITFTGGSTGLQNVTGFILTKASSGYKVISTVSTPTITATDSVSEAWGMTFAAFKAANGSCGGATPQRGLLTGVN